MSEIYEHSNIFAVIVVFFITREIQFNQQFLDFRPHVKGIYIYSCKSDFIFDLDGIEVELPRKVVPAGGCDMIR